MYCHNRTITDTVVFKMTPIQSIAFVINLSKPNAQSTAEALADIAQSQGKKTQFITQYPLETDCLKNVDLCCVIGGDGTLLGVLDASIHCQTKVLGINIGKLGFLATYTPNQLIEDFSSILEGDYSVEERSILFCQSNTGETAFALNDLVIKESENRGLIRLKVKSEQRLISEYHCDGLIFASPTGSTAYNLSAGGPIISPNVEAIAMTPICPHTLGNRSVIFDSKTPIEVLFDDLPAEPLVSIDGKKYFKKKSLSSISIQLAKERFPLIHNQANTHFSIVRDKLNWGDPTVR
jgi:NAD+ kinase